MNKCLSKFYVSVRRKDGTFYKRNSLLSVRAAQRAALDRHVISARRCSLARANCRISYREGLGTSPCIMGLTTQDPYIQKEHTELYKILNC